MVDAVVMVFFFSYYYVNVDFLIMFLVVIGTFVESVSNMNY